MIDLFENTVRLGRRRLAEALMAEMFCLLKGVQKQFSSLWIDVGKIHAFHDALF